MTRSWYVAKYVGDLMRDEPRNLGIIALDDSDYCSRFVGQRDNGIIDGRRAQWVNSVETYKMWVKHWNKLAAQSTDGTIATSRRPGDNYFLSARVDALVDNGAQLPLAEQVDLLFGGLVAEEREIAVGLKEQVEAAFKHLEVANKVHPDQKIVVRAPDSSLETLHFDYRYDHDEHVNLMQRVNLLPDDRRAWEKVYASSYMFSRLHSDETNDALKSAQCIALVQTGRSDRKRQLQQIRTLERTSVVVDFRDDAKAEQRLAELLVA